MRLFPAFVFVLASMLYASFAIGEEELVNIVQNPSFENEFQAWSFWTEGGAVAVQLIDSKKEEPIEGRNVAYVEIDNGGTGKNHIQFYQGGLTLKAGKKYTLCVWAKSDGDRPVELCVQHHVNPWTSYTRKQVTFTDSWNEYTVTFDQPEDDTNARVNIYLGLSDIDVWIDHVRLYEGEYFDDEIRGKPEEQPVISQDRLIATWGKLKVR